MFYKVTLVRLFTVAILMLLTIIFVGLVANTMRGMKELPVFSERVFQYNHYAYFFPILILAIGSFLLRKGESAAVALEILISVAWIAAICWIMAAAFAWEYTQIRLVN